MIEIKFYLSRDITLGKPTEGLSRGKDSEGIYFSLSKLVPKTPIRLKKFPIRKVVIEYTDAIITNIIEGEHHSDLGWGCVHATEFLDDERYFATIYVSANTYEQAFKLFSFIRNGRWADVTWNTPHGISEDNFSGIEDMRDTPFGYLYEDEDDDEDED